jgi:hypothetical protein
MLNELQKRIYANGGFRLDVATTPNRVTFCVIVQVMGEG